MTQRIAVIGAGPAGMTAAYALAKVTSHVDVYEASDSVGGMARSFEFWGQTVDLGPHRFFSHDRRVNELWLEVVGSDCQRQSLRRQLDLRSRTGDAHGPHHKFPQLDRRGVFMRENLVATCNATSQAGGPGRGAIRRGAQRPGPYSTQPEHQRSRRGNPTPDFERILPRPGEIASPRLPRCHDLTNAFPEVLLAYLGPRYFPELFTTRARGITP
jgi:hypothetical protein